MQRIERVEGWLQSYKAGKDFALLLYGLRFVELIGHSFMAVGRLDIGERCLGVVAKYADLNSRGGINNLKHLGIVQFMRGHVGRARKTFEGMSLAQRFIRSSSRISPEYLFLGDSWFAAIGHVAMIDLLLKQRDLGWSGQVRKFVVVRDVTHLAGKTILESFGKHGVEHAKSLQQYYERHRAAEDPEWGSLREEEQESLVSEFWNYSFADGTSAFYAHGAAKIQKEWEDRRLPPVLDLSDSQREAIGILLQQLGIPKDGWYVCLHVRESGFHGRWNRLYPCARDADIDTYYPAIRAIVERGGWVIRMGDPTMKPLRTMDGVVDYVQSNLKSESADVLLAAGCRFMLGTNSGFSILPATYGKPCVLTNWVPISLPNWYGIDLMIPKLMRDKASGRLIRFETMLADPLGAIQNQFDFPDNIEIVENTPDEIRAVTVEMLDRREGATYTARDEELQDRYFELAVRKGSYRGSRLGREFLEKYRNLLPETEAS